MKTKGNECRCEHKYSQKYDHEDGRDYNVSRNSPSFSTGRNWPLLYGIM